MHSPTDSSGSLMPSKKTSADKDSSFLVMSREDFQLFADLVTEMRALRAALTNLRRSVIRVAAVAVVGGSLLTGAIAWVTANYILRHLR